MMCFFFLQAEDGIRDIGVTGVQTCALPIWYHHHAQPGTPPETWPRMVVVPVVGTAAEEVRAAIWILNTEAPALPSEELLNALFLLSPAEARLAIGLLKGMSAAECAQQSGVGVATVRSQLHSIFSKTGVRHQAQLVALLSKVPVLRLSGSR